MKKTYPVAALATLGVLLFLHAPLFVLMGNSFNASRFGGTWEGWTLQWYERLFSQREVWESLWLSLKLGILSALSALILGTCAALALHGQRQGLLNRLHESLVLLPLAMPDILAGMGLLALFMSAGISTGLFSLWVAHSTFCLSYVAIILLARLRDLDPHLLEAAKDLGASRWQTLRFVLLPLLRPALLAAFLLAFTLSLDDYVISFFVSGPGTSTLPLRIASLMKTSRSLPVINALSTLLISFTFLLSTAAFFVQGRKNQA